MKSKTIFAAIFLTMAVLHVVAQDKYEFAVVRQIGGAEIATSINGEPFSKEKIKKNRLG